MSHLAPKYRKSKKKAWYLRLKTSHPDGDCYDGVVAEIKRQFIILCEVTDFEFDGLQILPKKSIIGCRDGRFERCSNEIIRQNGEFDRMQPPGRLASCNTLKEVVACLYEDDIWPAVEVVDDGHTDWYFFLGPIVKLLDDGFVIRSYDAAGHWEHDSKLLFSEIFRIEVHSRYCKHFNSFMRSKRDE
jgi:hypothetical protein